MTLTAFAADSGALLQSSLLTFNRQEQGPHMLFQTTSTNRNLIPCNTMTWISSTPSTRQSEEKSACYVPRSDIKSVINVYVVMVDSQSLFRACSCLAFITETTQNTHGIRHYSSLSVLQPLKSFSLYKHGAL